MALTIGVLGGMGPAATLDFMRKAIEAGAGPREQDNVRLIVDCNPGVLDRNAGKAGDGPSPGPGLAAMARGLAAAGADFLVMACNAAHAWQGDAVHVGALCHRGGRPGSVAPRSVGPCVNQYPPEVAHSPKRECGGDEGDSR